MQIGFRASKRFRRSVFCGRCRRHLLAGLALFVLAGLYGTWAASNFSRRGADTNTFDRPLVRLADPMIRRLVDPVRVRPQNVRELYMVTAITDQHDTLVGMTVLGLRLIIVMTAAGLGLVLLTAGATEWEIRSEGA